MKEGIKFTLGALVVIGVLLLIDWMINNNKPVKQLQQADGTITTFSVNPTGTTYITPLKPVLTPEIKCFNAGGCYHFGLCWPCLANTYSTRTISF